MDRKMWLALLLVNFMLIIFIGTWHKQKTSSNQEHIKITERLDTLEKKGAYDFSLENIKGNRLNFYDIQGDIILLHFWATWCAPCVVEYPSLVELVENYKGKLQLVAVSSDDEKKDILRFLQRFGEGGKNVHHLWDEKQEVASLFGTEKLPETYIFDSEFRLIRKVPNTEEWGAPRVREFFDFLLEQTD